MDQPTRRRTNSGATALPLTTPVAERSGLSSDALNLATGVLANDLFGRSSHDEVLHDPILSDDSTPAIPRSLDTKNILQFNRPVESISHIASGLDSMGVAVWKLDLRSGRVELDEDSQQLFRNTMGVDPGCLEEGRFGFTTYAHADDRDRLLALLANGPVSSDADLSLKTHFRIVDNDGGVRWILLRVSRSKLDPQNELWFMAENQTREKAEEERQKKLLSDRILASLWAASNGSTLELLESTQFSAIELIDSLTTKWQPKIEKLKIRWMGPDAGLLGPVSEVVGSKALLEMLADCLFENAIEAVHSNPDLHPWIRFEFFEDDDSIFFAITDSGPGVPLLNRGSVFDPFFSTRPEHSSGLGLTIARSAAEWHSGTLRLDHFSKNTRFIAQIPKRKS